MIQIILVNEESRASQYGIGTYIKQLCLILSQKQGIHLSVICCRSTKNDFYIERKGDIDYYHIPDTIQNNDPEIRIKTYYKNIWYLIFPYFSSHSKENIILHINYYQHIHLLNTFRTAFLYAVFFVNIGREMPPSGSMPTVARGLFASAASSASCTFAAGI